MTASYDDPVDWRRALRSHADDALAWYRAVRPRRLRTARDAELARYTSQARRIVRADPAAFEVVETATMLGGAASTVVEMTLRGPHVEPGALLWLAWRNAPERVGDADATRVAYWTTPVIHRPSRRATTTLGRLRTDVIDLSAGEHADWRRAPRIVPRCYTVSAADGDLARLQVTRAAAWPERASAHLHRARPGDKLTGWILPNPYRLDRTRPIFAVATGSGAAAVFAALRTGARGVHLLWGVGDKTLAPHLAAELERFTADGRLATLEIARAPHRVTHLLADRIGDARAALAAGGTIFVSGNHAMGEAVDATLTATLGPERDRAHDELRYLVSA